MFFHEFLCVLSFVQSFSLSHLSKLHIWSNWNLRSFTCFLTLGSCVWCSVPQFPLPRPMVNVLIQVSYCIILLLWSLKWRHSCFLTVSCKRLCGGTFSYFALSKPADAPCFSRLWRTNFLQVPKCELPFHLSETSHMLVTVSRTHLPLSFTSRISISFHLCSDGSLAGFVCVTLHLLHPICSFLDALTGYAFTAHVVF